MNPIQFSHYKAQGYNRIPLHKEVMADLDTPLSTFMKLANVPFTYLFESVHGGEKWGRYSIIGLPSHERIEVYGHTLTHYQDDSVFKTEEVADPLAAVEAFQAQFNVPDVDHLPRFNGGLVGFFGYDCVRYIEKKLANSQNPDEINTPDILLMVSDELVVFDNLQGKLIIIKHVNPHVDGAYEAGMARLDTLTQQLETSVVNAKVEASAVSIQESDFKSGFGEGNFKNAVDKIKSYILDGDIMQCVISQRMSIPFDADALTLYRALRRLNPSPYMYYLNLGEFEIVGSSPEILTRLEDNEVTVRPIAGTRRRGKTDAEDIALETELLNDPKEIAEHLMLIDLGRNDAGRVSEIGTVTLTDKMIVERYSHVMHIVSNVTGELLKGKTAMDVLRATLPAGTLSGAPKIRAMEIIDEFEPVKRGIYGGAIGYLSFNGNMDLAIAIRTAVIKDKILHIQAGAGVVADSQPQLEWKETMNKGRAIFKAVELALNGLKEAN